MKDRSGDMAEEFGKERKTLSQIEKARDAVRRKYKLLKEGNQAVEKAFGETFKPIVYPLERLVTATDTNARETKNLMPKTEVKEENQDFEVSSFKTAYDDTEEEDDESTELPRGNSSVEKYLHMLNMNRKKFLDMTYGVRKLADGTLMIGDSPITLENEYVIVNGHKYMPSVGSLELLFRKQPDADLISAEDKNNYGKILKATKAYRKHYSPDEVIQKQTSNRYKTYIAPFISDTPSRKRASLGKGLPQYQIARRDTRMDYVYWDDPNELVDRLCLLLAERSAGNPSHINEIVLIIEELREVGIVY